LAKQSTQHKRYVAKILGGKMNRDKSEPIEFAHLHNRIFLAGLNKQLEKGIDQRSCQGIQMWRQPNGDVYWEYQGKCGYLGATLFQSLVCSNTADAIRAAKKKALDAKAE
jgi:hypothetical protein